jgi:desulfoferrodoxin (superoxide reductase-like protein)
MRLLRLSLLLPGVVGFCSNQAFTRSRVSALDAATDIPAERTSSVEVSRRAALVVAAALVSGVSPAYAASLSQAVSKLENENLAEVNSKGAPEKHLPKVSVSDGNVQIVVPHVMDPEKPHYIEYVWLKDEKSGKVLAAKAFKAIDSSPPTLSASVKSGTTARALLYCNLHGLWEGEAFSV